jgi:hypothetical protein
VSLAFAAEQDHCFPDHHGLAARLQDQIGELIERVRYLRAHDQERRDHQIEAVAHDSLEPNTFRRLTHCCEGPRTDFNTHC